MFSARDKIVTRGTHSGPYEAIEAVGKRAEVPAVPFVPSDGKADEVSAIPGQFTSLKQIGNFPMRFARRGRVGDRCLRTSKRGPHLRRRLAGIGPASTTADSAAR